MTASSQPLLSGLFALLMGLMPVLLLTMGGGSFLFYLIVALAVVVIARQPVQALDRLRPYRALILWLGLSLLAAIVSQALNGNFNGSEIERGVRVSLAFPLVLGALLLLEARVFKLAVAGLIVAGVASTLVVLFLIWPDFKRPPTPEYNAVTYGNLMLIMSVVAAYSVWWPMSGRPDLERTLKLAAAVLTFAGFVLTQTRTGWLALPAFVLIGILLKGKPRHPLRELGLLLGILAVMGAIGLSSAHLRDRIQEGVDEIHQCVTKDDTADTSMCIRLQLWRNTWQMFMADPWSGMGGGQHFSQELEKRVSRGEVSQLVADTFGEPHNDMLLALSSRGILGGLALLALYLAPAWLFGRRLLNYDAPPEARAAAAIGLALCLGFCICGITETMFRGMRSLGFYVVFVALFVALSDPRHLRAAQR